MPFINHACIPPVCFKRKLLAAGAIVNLYVTVGGAAKPVVNVTAQFPKLLQQGLAELQKMANLDCDGCVCFRLKLPNPPMTTTTPPIIVETNSDTDAKGVVTVYESYIPQIASRLSMNFPTTLGTRAEALPGGRGLVSAGP